MPWKHAGNFTNALNYINNIECSWKTSSCKDFQALLRVDTNRYFFVTFKMMSQEKLPFRNVANRFLQALWFIACILPFSTSALAETNTRPLRIGLPQSIFHTQFALIADWQQYLQNKLHRPVEIVNSRRFSDSIAQLHMGKLDFAWVTDYPNTPIGYKVRLLAVPLYKGRPFFTSYLIVPASDTQTTTLLQLKGMVLAFADPTSNSHVDHRYVLFNAGEDPRRFFRKVFFTHAHRESIEAVILGLANAAEVDNFAWDAMAKDNPELALQTRIVARSQEFGAPPLVANYFVSKEEFADMQHVLMGMAQDPEGQKLLKRIHLDGFIPGEAKFYERLIQMRKALGEE
jgi:phosphonate transport system substrate-binding protein